MNPSLDDVTLRSKWPPSVRPAVEMRFRGAVAVPESQYAVQVGDLQWVRIPSGQLVARPEATRAAQGGNDVR